jgi:hypothetical protein
MACPQQLRRLPEGSDEGTVAIIEVAADLSARGVEERRVRLLRTDRPLVRILPEDRSATEDRQAGGFPLRRGFFFDLADELGDGPDGPRRFGDL